VLCIDYDLQLLPDIIAVDIIAARRYGYICYSPLPTPLPAFVFPSPLSPRSSSSPFGFRVCPPLHSTRVVGRPGDPVMAICPVGPPSDGIDGCRSVGRSALLNCCPASRLRPALDRPSVAAADRSPGRWRLTATPAGPLFGQLTGRSCSWT
jgi:hypothetical protein